MDEDKREEYAKNLAQMLVLTGEKTFRRVFTVDKQDDDLVVVLAIRTNSKGQEALQMFSERYITKAVAGPYGLICPMCNGTGRLSP